MVTLTPSIVIKLQNLYTLGLTPLSFSLILKNNRHHEMTSPLGHPHYQAMKNIKKLHLFEGLKDNVHTLEPCQSCILGKIKQTYFPKSNTNIKQPLQLIHSDLRGPMQTTSITGSRYFLTFIEDHTKFTMVSFLK